MRVASVEDGIHDTTGLRMIQLATAEKRSKATRNSEVMKMCASIESSLTDQSQSQLLSTIMNIQDLESVRSVDARGDGKNIKLFVETKKKAPLENTLDGELMRKKRKKITIIRRKKHRDGSIDSVKHDIYQNYGPEYAEKQILKQ